MTLREYLDQQEMRATAFAKLIGVSDATISRILAGTQYPSLATALAIEKVTKGKIKPGDWRRAA